MSLYDAEICAQTFASRFQGLPDAYGLGRGSIVRETPEVHHYLAHLRGLDSGIGIFPLLRDGTLHFAAVDLDEADFDLAFEIATLLPGKVFVERSRSGNAHIWVFFKFPIEAWVVRGVMRAVLEALGRKDVEVFPKQDSLRDDEMLGNYINLPYHGTDRPMLEPHTRTPLRLWQFCQQEPWANPDEWRSRARTLGVTEPEARAPTSEWGEREQLHECVQYIYDNRFANPLAAGHRSVVLFSCAKQLLNWRVITSDKALEMLHAINDAGADPLPGAEVQRILTSAERGQYTSTGCDDAVFLPYAHPDCRIAHG